MLYRGMSFFVSRTHVFSKKLSLIPVTICIYIIPSYCNLQDKALLNKPADERTELEKRYIYRIIGGLKCFKKYPNVRRTRFTKKIFVHVSLQYI